MLKFVVRGLLCSDFGDGEEEAGGGGRGGEDAVDPGVEHRDFAGDNGGWFSLPSSSIIALC